MEYIPLRIIQNAVSCTRMAKRGDITTHDMFLLNRTSHPSHAIHAESCARMKHVGVQREDRVHGIDFPIIPRNSRDAEQHTYKTRGQDC